MAVSNVETNIGGMRACHHNALLSCIKARDLRPKARQGLAEQPSATAHIEHAQAVKRASPSLACQGITDEGNAQRIEHVQKRHRPAFFPPAIGQGGKAADLVGIKRGSRLRHPYFPAC